MVHKLKTIRGDMLVLQCQLERELIRYVRRYLCQPQVTIITNDKQFIFMCELYDYVENTEFPPEMVSSLMKTKNVLELSWDECLMFLGTLCFEFLPGQMLAVFSGDSEVIAIGTNGFHYIGISFIFMVTSLIFPVFFQAIGYAVKSSVLTIVRTVLFFVPLGYIFSRFGLQYFWLTFPVTELLTSVIGVGFYRNFLKREQTI